MIRVEGICEYYSQSGGQCLIESAKPSLSEPSRTKKVRLCIARGIGGSIHSFVAEDQLNGCNKYKIGRVRFARSRLIRGYIQQG